MVKSAILPQYVQETEGENYRGGAADLTKASSVSTAVGTAADSGTKGIK